MRYLFVSTPVGPFGSGVGGGVELIVNNLVRQIHDRGGNVHVLAPEGSQLGDIPHTLVPGLPPDFAQTQSRTAPIVTTLPSTLANLWETARQMAPDFDIIVNWCYDWLPFYLTPFFDLPIAHIVSMGSLNDGLDSAISQVRHQFPGTVAVFSRTQAETFPNLPDSPFKLLPCGIDLEKYAFVDTPQPYLSWVGRISPEKGLEDCAAVSQILQLPVAVLGKMQDSDYWEQIQRDYPQAQLDYKGFLPTEELQKIVGQSRCALVTPKWVEAFGMVVLETLACGVPVVAYDRGGPAEIVVSGKSGWVVTPDSVSELVDAVRRLDEIDRRACRLRVEEEYSVAAMYRRFCKLTSGIVRRHSLQH